MSRISRRTLLTAGLSFTAGAAGVLSARRAGLIPPDALGPYGAGNSLNYAAHRLLVRDSLAREFGRDRISKPFPNSTAPKQDDYQRHLASGFRDWTLTIDGLVERPASYTLDGLKRLPVSSQITQLTCEEGWSFIAEWTGVALRHVLQLAGLKSSARHVAYISLEEGWWDSIDIGEALHPQTLVTYGMNGADLPVGHGGPLRVRVPRQLGYKNVKYISRITVLDDIRKFKNGKGSSSPDFGYSWFAGI